MKEIIILSLIVLNFSATIDKTCKDPNGKEVDWYAVFLLPQSSDPKNELVYGYFGEKSTDIEYFIYDDANFPPNRVTELAMSDKNDFNFFFWNDDKTCKDDTEAQPAPQTKAHSKGELIMDKNSGVYLLHSLPRFPSRKKDGTIFKELPSNAGIYGQSFLCITTSNETSNKIVQILNYINISNNLSVSKDRVNKDNEWIKKLIMNVYSSTYPKSLTASIESLKGTNFTFFSKSHRHNYVPYDDTLRQAYNTSFFVRTWSRPSLSPSVCDKNKIINIYEVDFQGRSFGKHQEHSKWAVSRTKNICCFGDVNHVASQAKRGGSIVCFENKKLAEILRNTIVEKDVCTHS